MKGIGFKRLMLLIVFGIFVFSCSFVSAAPTQTCYAVHGAAEDVGYGTHNTFDNVTFAISDTVGAVKAEYKSKAGGIGYEAAFVDTNWNLFSEKIAGQESYFFTDVYTADTKISGTVYFSAESKDKNGEGLFNWTLYEYDPDTNTTVYNFGSVTWDATGLDDPIDSQFSVTNHTVSSGNRLMLRLMGKLDAIPMTGELKVKLDEVGMESSTTVTSTYCSNIHSTYKSFVVMVLSEEEVTNAAPDTPVLNDPENNSNFSVNYVLLNITVTDSDGDNMTVWFYGDGALIDSQADIVNGSVATYNWTALSDGLHNWSVIAGDGTDNTTSGTYYFTIDITAPEIEFVSPSTNEGNVSQDYIVGNVSVSDDNLDNVVIYLYNSSGLVNSSLSTYVNFSGLVDGTYYLNASANDSVGNENSTETLTIVLDTIAPSLEIISPLNQSYNNATVLINVSSDGDNVWYNWNGTNVTYTSAVNVTFAEGANALVVYANDSVGNLNATNVSFTVDTTAPTFDIVPPLGQNYTNATILVNISINHGGAWYNWNGTNATYTSEISVTFDEGFNTLYVWANDSLGNLNSSNVSFFVDGVAPLIEFVEPSTNTTNCSREWIVGNVSASDDNLDSVVIYLYNSSGLVNSSTGTYVNFTGLDDGTYYLNATANDSGLIFIRH